MQHDDGYFDARIAARYDESSADVSTPEVVDPIVNFLAELADSGRALELGIGTGRIALPLARRGVPGDFSLAYLVFNTIGNLTRQEAQVACFQNVAAHLASGGCFVIEVGVPDLQRLPPGETVRPFDVSDGHIGFDEIDIANQGLVSHHFTLVDGRWERYSIPFRYAWPAELDLMAQLAGMRLRERWGGWQREPFTSDSRKHVSVWEKP